MDTAVDTSTFISIPASTNSNPTSAAHPPADPLPRPIRRRFATTGRVRSGCLTCKRRKKKCDDQRGPYDEGEGCQSCTRLGLVCERAPLRTVTPQQQKRKHSNAQDREMGEGACGDGRVRVRDIAREMSRGSRGNTEDRRKSCISDADSVDNADNTDSTDNTDDASSSSGSPSLPYQLPASKDGSGADGDIGDFVKTPSSGFMALFALEGASPERILLKYYVEHLAPLCSILQEGKNDFRNVLLPMAIDDSSLLYALFAYASIHVPSSGKVPSITPLMRLKFETQAARGLSEAIRLNSVSESSVACALICSTAEVVSGDTKRWLVHLKGAGHLLNELGGPENLRRTSDGRFLMRNFAYHDIMAAFSTGGRPIFRGLYWLDSSSFVSPDCLMGFAHGILGHMSDMCYFMADIRDQGPLAPDGAASVIHEGERIAQALRSQPLDICTTLNGTEHESLVYHAETYRFSALLHLYRFLSRFTADDTAYSMQMTECTQIIMRHIYQVPSNLSCEVGFVFPLFMVGVACADDDASVTYIRSRLNNIERWTKFQHVARIRELLEMLWASGHTDWEGLLRTLGWQISLA
ncbi:hypothetical protein VE03_00640 [Pseudogymnoascus sp. 23342-1-I1]|nr:hypothetical protein VE03_00640 [Pseudogymnoascus sp. 23342-1-I1]